METKTPGQVAYEAYRDRWMSLSIQFLVPWSELRFRDEWEVAAAAVRKPLEDKLAAARIKLREIVCTEEPDAGVVLLSYDSPTYIDPETGHRTYRHRYFSPLGDAMMALYQILGE